MIIYYIKNKINDKLYIGRTIQPLKKRINAHFYTAKKKRYKIEKAISKYGKENFRYGILCECNSEEALFFAEQHFIKKYNTMSKGYNSTEGGVGGAFCEESRLKISLANKGKTAWNKGLTADTDFRVASYGRSKRGYKFGKGTRQKMSESAKISSGKRKNEFKQIMQSKTVCEKRKASILKNNSQKHENNGRWKEIDLKELKKLFYNDYRIIDIANHFNVGSKVISKRIQILSLKRKKKYKNVKRDFKGENNPRWNKNINENKVIQLYNEGINPQQISIKLNIPRTTLSRRLKTLGLNQ